MHARSTWPAGVAVALVAGALVAALIAAIVAGGAYEQEARRQDLERLPRIGRAVDIGGRTLNIYCSGEGAPAVILESGAPVPAYSWVRVQREIAKFTRACWYDRAGYAWSDPGPHPRNSLAIAKDLHGLLQAANISSPYVLVGATFGGIHVRTYTHLYPDDVSGVVLVDAVHGDEETRIPQSRGLAPASLHYPQSLVAQAFNEIGLWRATLHPRPSRPPPQGLTPEEWATIQGLSNLPKTRLALLQELVADIKNEARDAGDLGSRPLIVLSSTDSKVHSVEMELQAELVRLSTHAEQILVEHGDNAIPYNSPDSVVMAVRDVVTQVRSYQRR